MIDKQKFQEKFSIHSEIPESRWNELVILHDDFINRDKNFKCTADSLFMKFSNFANVHSIRKRIKDAEHLIEKIVRKGMDDVNVNNYKERITDLIGIRILHLYKEDWTSIHHQILKMSRTAPIEISVKYRLGDELSTFRNFPDIKFEEHSAGYRSVHYLIRHEHDADESHIVEIQVRTVFEEAWSEIDHHIRYPYMMDDEVLNSFLLGFNTIAKSADDMGMFGLKLKKELLELKSIKQLRPVTNDGIEVNIVDSEFKAARKNRTFDKSFFLGVWESRIISQIHSTTRTTYYFKVINDEIIAPYSYMSTGELTGEYFDVVYYRNLFFGKFQWFEHKDMFGYAYWEKIDDQTLRGGWCLDENVPEIVRRDITQLDVNMAGFVRIEIKKIADGDAEFPENVKAYFRTKEFHS